MTIFPMSTPTSDGNMFGCCLVGCIHQIFGSEAEAIAHSLLHDHQKKDCLAMFGLKYENMTTRISALAGTATLNTLLKWENM